MREYEIKGLSAEEVLIVTKSLQFMSRLTEDDEYLGLINEVLKKIRASVEAK